jgi:hypothetical protein
MGRQGGGLQVEEFRAGNPYDELQNTTNSSVNTIVVKNDETVARAEPPPPDPPLLHPSKQEDNKSEWKAYLADNAS